MTNSFKVFEVNELDENGKVIDTRYDVFDSKGKLLDTFDTFEKAKAHIAKISLDEYLGTLQSGENVAKNTQVSNKNKPDV